MTDGDDLRRDLSGEEIDRLIREDPSWFPFVEVWSKRSPQDMMEALVSSPYGDPATLPTVDAKFSPSDFAFFIPHRFLKPIAQFRNGNGEGRVILTRDVGMKDYREMNAVGEFFMEDVRLSTAKRRFMKLTPEEMWDRDKVKIVEQARRRYGEDKTGPYEIRNTFFSVTHEANPFRPSVALAIYALFNARSILDMSAGWGDRLIAAIAWAKKRQSQVTEGRTPSSAAVRYQGYDPFTLLQERYQAIIRDLGGKTASLTRFEVEPTPFEEAPIEEEEFDLAFTSPPYFDFEEFGIKSSSTRESTQSTIRYPSLKEWIQGFLIPLALRAGRALRVNGHLALNIEGSWVTGFLEAVSKDLNSSMKFEYMGILGYMSDEPRDRRIHPTFVWRRLSKI